MVLNEVYSTILTVIAQTLLSIKQLRTTNSHSLPSPVSILCTDSQYSLQAAMKTPSAHKVIWPFEIEIEGPLLSSDLPVSISALFGYRIQTYGANHCGLTHKAEFALL